MESINQQRKLHTRRATLSVVAPLALVLALAGRAESAEPVRALGLAEARQLAAEKSPDLATARLRVEAARAALQEAAAAFWPQVRASAGYAASDNPVQAFMMPLNQREFDLANADLNHPDTTDNLNLRLYARYEIYDGGQRTAGRQAAQLRADAIAEMLAAVHNDLAWEVTRAFHLIGRARQHVRAAEAAVTNMAANVTLALNRVEQGVALKTDRLDAEVRLAQAREDLVRARNAVALAEAVFRHALGVGQDEPVTAAQVSTPVPEETPAEPFDLSQRAEVRAAEKAVAAAERQVRAAQSGQRPRVSAFASYDVDSGNVQDFADSWLAGVNVELDVFDGFLTRGRVAGARANLDAQWEQLRKVQLAVQLEVIQARLNLEEARTRLETTSTAVAQAEESLQITRERYSNGLALLTQLLDAETALTGSRQRRAAAESDYWIARAALDRALGRLGRN